MTICIHLKDPDGFYESIIEAAKESCENIEFFNNAEKEALIEQRIAFFQERLRKWVVYDETISIDFDLDSGKATVLEVSTRAF